MTASATLFARENSTDHVSMSEFIIMNSDMLTWSVAQGRIGWIAATRLHALECIENIGLEKVGKAKAVRVSPM